MTVPAGKRDTRCTFQQATETADGGGGFTVTWADQFSRWGALTPPNLRSNMESIVAGSVQNPLMADLVIPSDTQTQTITEDWRMTARGKTWNIRRVHPHDEGDIRMVVEAGVPT